MTSVLGVLQAHPNWESVLEIVSRLEAAGYRVLLAGGCVRDALRGVQAQDLDLATSATPDAVIALFEKTVQVGKAFGVVRVLLGGADIEVATFRRDGPSQDGRRPDRIEFSDEQEDARRRDFTVNALFYDFKSDSVLDYINGIKDLNLKILRTVGDPLCRFQEDHLRILRALRFSIQLGFKISDETWSAIRGNALLVGNVSGERVRDELWKAMRAAGGVGLGRLLTESGVWSVLFPELRLDESCFQTWSLAFQTVPTDREGGFLRLFLPWVKGGQLDSVLGRIKLSRQEERALHECFLAYAHPEQIAKMRRGKALFEYHRTSVRAALDLYELVEGPLSWRKELHEDWLNLSSSGHLPAAFLRGDDLLGLMKGKRVGEALDEAYCAQLEGEFTSRQGALTWLGEWLKLQRKDEGK